MALDEATKARYRESGPAVMAALLPELRREAERALEKLERFGRSDSNSRPAHIKSVETTFKDAHLQHIVAVGEREQFIVKKLQALGLLPPGL